MKSTEIARMSGKNSHHKKAVEAFSFWEYLKVIILALVFAGIIRGFLFEPFKIPSTSMVPTLLIGDYLFVTKYAYGVRIPFTKHFVTETLPERGDVVVFKHHQPHGGEVHYIKRLVALPGDKVAYMNKRLFVNDVPVGLVQEGPVTYAERGGGTEKAIEYTETLAKIEHPIALTPRAYADDVAPTVVPAGHFVMMGDNRDNSADSRKWNYPAWGFAKQEDIVGRAEFIWWSWSPCWAPKCWVPRFERFFVSLRPEQAV